MEASCWERLTVGETRSCSDELAMLNKYVMQFSIGGQSCVSSLQFDLRPDYGGGNEDNGSYLQKDLCMHCHTQCPQPCNRPLLTQPPPKILRHSWASLNQSLVGSLLLSPECCCAQGFVCVFKECVSPVLCKFWLLYGGVNGDLLQECLCHSQVGYTQSPCPCKQSTTYPCLHRRHSLKALSGSVSVGSPGTHKALFEPSNLLWWAWGLILKVIQPLLSSF